MTMSPPRIITEIRRSSDMTHKLTICEQCGPFDDVIDVNMEIISGDSDLSRFLS